MSYEINSILQLMNPSNTMSVNRYLAHAMGMCETMIYSALISKFTYYASNGQTDEEGWFYSTEYDLQESTTYGERQQRVGIKHLIENGLIECKRFGMPARRYFRVLNNTERISELISEGMQIANELIEKGRERNAKKSQQRSERIEKSKTESVENSETSCSDILQEQVPAASLFLQNDGTGSCKSAEQVPAKTRNTTSIKLNLNKLNLNKTDGLIDTRVHAHTRAREAPNITPEERELAKREAAEKQIKENIEYDWFAEMYEFYPQKVNGSMEELDDIVGIMVDVVCCKEQFIRVGKTDIPKKTVTERFMKITEGHINYIFDNLEAVRPKIRDQRAYYITALYNAVVTYNSSIQADIRHDMPITAWKGAKK